MKLHTPAPRPLAQRIAACAVCFGVLGGPALFAANEWQGTSPFAWDTGTNWTLGIKPSSSDDVIFGSLGTTGSTLTLSAGELSKSLSFTESYTLGSAANNGDLTIATGSVSVSAGKTATINTQLIGTSGLAITGGGTVALAGTNTNFYSTNGVVVNGSTLQIAADAALGSASTNFNNVTLLGSSLNFTNTAAASINVGREFRIGTGTSTFNLLGTADVTIAGNFTTANSSSLGRGDFVVAGNLGRTLNVTDIGDYTGSGTGITVRPGVYIAFGAALPDPTVIVQSDATKLGGIGVNSTTDALPFFKNDDASAAFGGLLLINGTFSEQISQYNVTDDFKGGFLLGSTQATLATSGVYRPNNHVLVPDVSDNGPVFRLGGGGGFITLKQVLLEDYQSTPTAMEVGDPRLNGGGTVVLANDSADPTINPPTSTFTGEIRIKQGTLSVSSVGSVKDGGTGLPVASLIGLGSADIVIGSDTTAGAFAITAGGTDELTSRGLRIGTGGGTVTVGATAAVNFRVASVTGPGALTKLGLGTLTSSGTGSVSLAGLTVNAGSINLSTAASTSVGALAVNSAGGVVTLSATGGTTATTGSILQGTVNLGAGTNSFSGSLAVGKNVTGTASLVVPAGGNLRIGTLNGDGTSTSVLDIGSRELNTGNASALIPNGTLDASLATGVTINVSDIHLEHDYGTVPGTGILTGTIKLPTSSMAINSIVATTSITVGDEANAGALPGVATFTLGGGTTNIATPTMLVGGRKTSGNLTLAAGGKLTLQGFTAGTVSGTTNLTIGANNVATSLNPVTIFDVSAGVMEAKLGALIVGQKTSGTSGNTGTATATFSLGSGANIIQSTSILIGNGTGISSTSANGTVNFAGGTFTNTGLLEIGKTATSSVGTGKLQVSGGTFVSTAGNTILGSTGTGTATGTLEILNTGVVNLGAISVGNATSTSGTGAGTIQATGGTLTGTTVVLGGVSGATGTTYNSNGTLNVAGGSVTFTGDLTDGGTRSTSVINLTAGSLNMSGKNVGTAANPITTLTFSGGTFKNIGTLSQALTQTGSTSLLDVADNDTSFTSTYALTDGTARVASGRTLGITGAVTVGGSTGRGLLNIRGVLNGASLTANTGTISGTGTVNPLTTINKGGEISPGNSGIGTLTFTKAVTFGTGGTASEVPKLTLELDAGQISDKLVVSGAALTLSNPDAVNLIPLIDIGSTPQLYHVATFGSVSGTFDSWFVNGVQTTNLATNGVGGNASAPNYINLIYTATALDISVANLAAVPEPATIGIFVASVGSLVGLQRLRMRSTSPRRRKLA